MCNEVCNKIQMDEIIFIVLMYSQNLRASYYICTHSSG